VHILEARRYQLHLERALAAQAQAAMCEHAGAAEDDGLRALARQVELEALTAAASEG
jgi:hypothetical protein